MANLLFNYNFIFNYNCNAAARYGLACGSSLSPGCAGGGGIAAAAVFASDPLCVPQMPQTGTQTSMDQQRKHIIIAFSESS